MKNFTHQSKLEQRLEHFDNLKLHFQVPQTRPIFLSNTQLTDKSSKIFLQTTKRPGTTCLPFPKSSLTFDNSEALEEVINTERDNSPISKVMTRIRRERSSKRNKRMMRRRSCCCEWCGGISKKDMKHKDIITDLEACGRDLPVASESPKNKLKRSITMSISLLPLLNLYNKKKVNTANLQLSEGKEGNIGDQDDFPPKLAKLLDNHVLNDQVLGDMVMEEGLNFNETSPDSSSRDKFEKTPTRKGLKITPGGLNFKEEPISPINKSAGRKLYLKKQYSLIPLKTFGKQPDWSPVHQKISEWSNVKTDSSPKLKNTSTDTSPKMKLASYNEKVIQNLWKEGSAYVPTSVTKINKLSTPVSLLSMGRTSTQLSKLESLKRLETESEMSPKLRIKTLPDFSPQKTSLIDFITKRNYDSKEGDLDQKLSAKTSQQFYNQLEGITKVKVKGLKGERKAKSTLKARNTRIQSIYVEDNSPVVVNKRSISRTKQQGTPSHRPKMESVSVLDSPTRAFGTSISFKETSRDFEGKMETKQEETLPEICEAKKRKTVRIKQRTEQFTWTPSDSPLSKKIILSGCLELSQNSLMDKIMKRRKEKAKTSIVMN